MIFKGIDRGVLFILSSSLLSALSGAFAKILGEEISALEIVFFRNLLGLLFILITLRHTPTTHPGGRPWLLIWRGLFGFGALFLYFYTITAIPLGEAMTLNKTSPLFVTILAFFLLHERLGKLAIFALLIGFAGVVLITKPFGMSVGIPHLLGLLGGLLAASAYTTIRKIRDIYDARMIVLSFMGMGVALPLLLFGYTALFPPQNPSIFLVPFVMPTGVNIWIMIVLMGMSATFSQWLLTKAYSTSRAGIIGIASYVNIPFAIFVGTMLGDSWPDSMTLAGISLIILSGLMVRRG
ncbi:MAG: EamA family transporter [Campylobacteraceae bacterium 4484_4]|nr:MAG: EamA family transporter [Campylobacteraceae bacterium 4484_4]